MSSLSQRKPSPLPSPPLSPLSPSSTCKSTPSTAPTHRQRQPIIPPTLYLLILTVLLGTVYSLYLHTHEATLFRSRFPTSHPHFQALNALIPEEKKPWKYNIFNLQWWEYKGNPFNVYFVKFAWAWTTLAYVALVGSYFVDKFNKGAASETESGKIGGLIFAIPYVISTFLWYSFTQKVPFFDLPSIFDILIVWTGGECVPSALSSSSSPSKVKDDASTAIGIDFDDTSLDTLSPLDPRYCYTHTRRSFRKSHPLPLGSFGRGKTYWNGGIDISGHAFLLVLSILFLLSALQVTSQKDSRQSAWAGKVRKAVGGLITLWWWMLWVTCVNFHSPSEKVTGMVVAIGAWIISWTSIKLLTL